MASFRSHDDPRRSAPYALCAQDDIVRLIAPADVLLEPGSMPPTYSFHRHDYFWLALSLSAWDDGAPPALSLEPLCVGTHTLTWPAMHATLQTAVSAGFSVPAPSDFPSAVKAALVWGLAHRHLLRRLRPTDFELLPAAPPAQADAWWMNTSFVSWQSEGLFHALCHAIGFMGKIWEAQSREAQSRFHLSLLLTQDFVHVSSSLPPSLYGDPAIQFYLSTMPPSQLVIFPTSLAKLHSTLSFRWNYHHGGSAQLHGVLLTTIPFALRDCPLLSRFLTPAANVTAQVTAYRIIVGILCPQLEAHRYETFTQVDKKLANYLPVLEQADSQESPVFAEGRAFLLQQAVDEEKKAIAAAPTGDGSNAKHEFAGSATQSIVGTLLALRAQDYIIDLEKHLARVWTSVERNPVEVFRAGLASRSMACVAILFGNLTGVRGAGPLFTALEQAAAERLQYFSFYLSTPIGLPARPDRTLWYSYPLATDTSLRSADFNIFAKINFFELGSHIRQLRDDVESRPQEIPKPGQEFSSGLGGFHLSLLNHIKVWLTALGFPLRGADGFEEMFNAFFNYCQHGVSYTGVRLEGHIKGMRLLYLRMLGDMHVGFQCFWSRRVQEYEQRISMDSLFPVEGAFYGTLRQLMLDVAKVNELSRLGVLFEAPRGPDGALKRKWADRRGQGGAASLSGAPAAAAKGAVGSFAWAVKEEGDYLTVGYTKYSKKLILEKLGVQASEFCLPSYLSWKGAEACPCQTTEGHEGHDSTYHVFTEEQLAMRSAFEEEPYRLPMEAGTQGSAAAGGRGGGRASGRGARGAGARGGRK